MVASTEQIKREIKALENTTSAIADEVSDLYARYLTTLGQSVRQQLILACYHLCTQNYPERFLRLSFSQRQQLQQAIKNIGKQAEQQLLEQIDTLQQVLGLAEAPVDGEMDADLEDENEGEELGERREEAEALGNQGTEVEGVEGVEGIANESEDEESADADADVLETITPDALARIVQEIEKNPGLAKETEISAQILPLSSALSLGFAIAGRQSESPFSAVEPGMPLSPMQLVSILEKLEHYIAEILQGASQAANRLLQKADILPKQLPEPVFAAAAKAGEAAEGPSSGPPNLLRLLVEVSGSTRPNSDEDDVDEDDNEDGEKPHLPITPLVAIHLRLSEIEFTTATLSVWRTKIRSSAKQLEGLIRQYKRKQQQLAIAEAESAWRSSWFED